MNWNDIESLNTVLGLIGFVLTFFTFILSIRIKHKVEQHMDKLHFSESIDEHIGQIKGIMDLIEINKSDINSREVKILVNDYSSKMKARYTILPLKMLWSLFRLTKLIDYRKLHIDSEYIKLRNELTKLISYLERNRYNDV